MSSIQQQQQRQQPQQQRRLTKRCSCDLLGMTEPLVSRPAPATLVTTATTATTVVTATANNATGTAQVGIVKYFQPPF